MLRALIGFSLFISLALNSYSHAQDVTFGAWTAGVMSDNDGTYAATINDSKAVFGQYCYFDGGNCVWLLANDINCENGHQAPVLINTDSGAVSLMVLCAQQQDGKPRYIIMDFDALNDAIKNSSWIGIAFPMKSGLFQVSRFSLDGEPKAVTTMRTYAASRVNKKGTGTRDQTF